MMTQVEKMKAGQKGFSLVELLVAMLISGLVMSAIYTVFNMQRKSYYVQDQVAEMQQNLRSALEMVSREVRMAGYDPSDAATCATIDTATDGRLKIFMDLVGNGDCDDANEEVEFGFSDGNDPDFDGLVAAAEGGAAELGRETGGTGTGFDSLAENIHAIGFAYAYDFDGDGDEETDATGRIIWARSGAGGTWWNLDANDDGVIDVSDAGGSVDTGDAANEADIRAVRIWILARASAEDLDFTNTATYVVGINVITPNDHYRRRLLEYNVRCRNMGLE